MKLSPAIGCRVPPGWVVFGLAWSFALAEITTRSYLGASQIPEESGDERTVAIIVRAEKAGGFLQGRYDPVTNKYWQGYGPKQLPFELK